MAEKYDKNGYNSSDFKRNNAKQEFPNESEQPQDGEEGLKLNEKAGEYMRELLSEKIKLSNAKFPISSKLIDQEVAKVQASGRIPLRDAKYMDVCHEKPVKVTVKVLVPVKEHPKFNFVGKLLGPKGNTMKLLQEETMCKMAVLGRGSMRDRQKEEELRNSLDPKYSHLTDELHVEVSALAPPAEAHARIAYALAEVKKYLIPEPNDMMRHPQMREIFDRDGLAKRPPLLRSPGGHPNVQYSACTVTKRSYSYGDPIIREGQRAGAPPGRAPRMPPAPPMARAPPPKAKVISILDRARTAMETSYYDDPYAPEPPTRCPRGAPEDFYYEPRGHERSYYDDEPPTYYKEEREYKARDVGTRRQGGAGGGGGGGGMQHAGHPRGMHHAGHARGLQHAGHARASPYARPPKGSLKQRSE